MRTSSSVDYTRLSPNCTKPRNGQIRRLTPHCVAGNLTVEAILGLTRFVTPDPKNGASCNYAIDSIGRMGLGVEETNRAWTTSSRANDMEAITYEIANDGGAPDWHMSDAAINAFMNHAVETAIFYGFKKFVYQEKPANITGPAAVEAWIATWEKDNAMLITLHRWYKAKDCPGSYLVGLLPPIVNELNRRLNGEKPQYFIGDKNSAMLTPSVTDTTESMESKESTSNIFTPYTMRITASALNIRKGPGVDYPVVKTLVNDKNIYTIVEETDGALDSSGKTGHWGKLKSGIGWLALSYTEKR